MRTRSFAALICALSLLASAPPAGATDIVCRSPGGGLPCAYQLDVTGIADAPGLIKLQFRLAQNKLPIGSGVIPELEVRLVHEGEDFCAETFKDVAVTGSVVNLLIGENLSCELATAVASLSDVVELQLCLGDTCNEAIKLGGAPYAMNVASAVHVRHAAKADRAARAHYVQRLAADRDIEVRGTLGAGYFTFATPKPSQVASIYTAAQFAPYTDAGFLAWAPVRNRSARRVHIATRDRLTDQVTWLDELVLGAQSVRTHGTLRVSGDVDVGGTLTVTGGSTFGAGPDDLWRVNGSATFASTLDVQGAVTIAQAVQVLGDTNIGTPNTTHRWDDTLVVDGDFTTQDSTSLGRAGVTVPVSGNLAAQASLAVTGASTFGGSTAAQTGFHGTSEAELLDAIGFVTAAANVRVGPANGRRWSLEPPTATRATLSFDGQAVVEVDAAGKLTGGTLKTALDAALGASNPGRVGSNRLSVGTSATMLTSLAVLPQASTTDAEIEQQFVKAPGYWILRGSIPCSNTTDTSFVVQQALPAGVIVQVYDFAPGPDLSPMATVRGSGGAFMIARVGHTTVPAFYAFRTNSQRNFLDSGGGLIATRELESVSFEVSSLTGGTASADCHVDYQIMHVWEVR